MQASKRIIINTIAQYTRSILNMALALVATRYVLRSLGVDDYGIYSVVAAAVSLLSFITNALTITTQRYLSVTQGKQDVEKSIIVFNTSLFLHFFVGLGVVVCLELLFPFLMNDFLNIPDTRLYAARVLYHIIVVIIFLTLITSPFRAVIVSHENIVFISVIEVMDAFFKLLIAISLIFFDSDRLIVYGALLLGIQFFNLFVLSSYAYHKYTECSIPSLKYIDKSYMKGLFSFAGWTMYNIGCNYGRVQGIAFVLNKTYSTTMNAAYGLGFQVSGALSSLSQSLANAINPQLMKSEGRGERERMLRFAEIESKFSFLMLAAISVPTLFEVESLLKLWLGEVPEYADLFCRMVLVASMCDALTVGLGAANQAVGNIRNYTILIYTTKLLTLPIIILLLLNGLPIYSVAIAYISIELFSAIIRIPFLHKTAGLHIKQFRKNVFAKEIIPMFLLTFSCFFCTSFIKCENRFLFTFLISDVIFIFAVYVWGLCEDEKGIASKYLHKAMTLLNI